MRREEGCGLWTVWLIVALFAAEWLFVCVLAESVPEEHRALTVIGGSIAILVVAVLGVYLRMQRRA